MTDTQAKAIVQDQPEVKEVYVGMNKDVSFDTMQALLRLTDEIYYDSFEQKYSGFSLGQICKGTAQTPANHRYFRTSIQNLKSRFNQELDEILDGVKL